MLEEPMNLPSRALVLFDIDGTLLRRSGPQHREALEIAVRRVTGHASTTEGIPVQGMLDRDILREMLRRAGAPASVAQQSLYAVMAEAERVYRQICPDLRAKVCPGVRRFLRGLRRADAAAGLVTGNLSRIGWRKMERAGLRGHFRFGAFAEQGFSRADLARRAAKTARRRGIAAPDARVALIGDHPNDIAAARSNGFVSVAVGTGVVPLDELRAHSPDLLVEDLRALTVEQLLCACGLSSSY
jgi:phosphoglycolate phosphatase-like HAD superfamily hydrolase